MIIDIFFLYIPGKKFSVLFLMPNWSYFLWRKDLETLYWVLIVSDCILLHRILFFCASICLDFCSLLFVLDDARPDLVLTRRIISDHLSTQGQFSHRMT